MRGQRHAPSAFYPQERPGTHCTGGWVGPRAGLDGCGNSRSPDRPARSQSLYRLSYPAHILIDYFNIYCTFRCIVSGSLTLIFAPQCGRNFFNPFTLKIEGYWIIFIQSGFINSVSLSHAKRSDNASVDSREIVFH
jgi:hypothetical protein